MIDFSEVTKSFPTLAQNYLENLARESPQLLQNTRGVPKVKIPTLPTVAHSPDQREKKTHKNYLRLSTFQRILPLRRHFS